MKSSIVISPVNIEARKKLGLRAGDTVRVWQNIVELKSGKAANKKQVTTKNTRRQAFEGFILAVKHGTQPGGTFTVRKVASGVGVEKIFPLFSPMIDSIEILKRARMRRAKLYFIRRKAARDVKRSMRRQMQIVAPLSEDVEPSSDVAGIDGEAPAVEPSEASEEIAA